MMPSTKANWIFLGTTAIWGTTFSIVENAVRFINPQLFVSLRFSIAACILFIFSFTKLKSLYKALFWAGIVLGFLNAINYSLQTVSLHYISAARCAFITGTGVAIVPVWSYLLKQNKLVPLDFIAAFLCIAGLYIVTGAKIAEFTQGDFLALLSTATWAFSVAYVAKLSSKHYDASLLTFLQVLFTAPFPLLTLSHIHMPLAFWSWSVLGAIVYCGAIATVLPLFFQAKYLKDTTASKAALIFALEPVFAAIFSALFFHETITRNIIFGGTIILFSITLPNWILACYRLKKVRA